MNVLQYIYVIKVKYFKISNPILSPFNNFEKC